MKSLVEFTFYLHSCYEAFAATGRKADCAYAQGGTLGWELLPLQGVWGAMYLRYKAAAKYPLCFS